MRKMILGLALVAMLSACQDANVYDNPLPSVDDADALMAVRDGVKQEDQEAWQNVVMRMANPMAKKLQSETVGEAITNMKAKNACVEENDITKVPEGPSDFMADDYQERNAAHIKKYNAVVDAYNACLEMPL